MKIKRINISSQSPYKYIFISFLYFEFSFFLPFFFYLLPSGICIYFHFLIFPLENENIYICACDAHHLPKKYYSNRQEKGNFYVDVETWGKITLCAVFVFPSSNHSIFVLSRALFLYSGFSLFWSFWCWCLYHF